jgi:hypothetical protein
LILRSAEPLRGLLTAGPVMRDLISLVAEKKGRRDRITMICDADTYFFEKEWEPEDEDEPRKLGMRDRRAASARQEQIASATGIERVIIEGFTYIPALTTVRDLIEQLRQAPFVEGADLLSDDKLVGDLDEIARMGRPFVIDVRIRKP